MRRVVAMVVLVAGAALASCGDDAEVTGSDGESEGRALFTGGTRPACADCHTLSAAGSTSQVGPSLDGSLAPDWFIAQVIRDGVGAMPALGGQLSDAEIDALAAYVEANSGQ